MLNVTVLNPFWLLKYKMKQVCLIVWTRWTENKRNVREPMITLYFILLLTTYLSI